MSASARKIQRTGTLVCLVLSHTCIPVLILVHLSLISLLYAQTTIGTGSIVGTVSDPSGAVVRGAEITITNVSTGQLVELTTNSFGFFNSGALVPGNYKTRLQPEASVRPK